MMRQSLLNELCGNGRVMAAKMAQHLKVLLPEYDPWDQEVEGETPASCPDLHTSRGPSFKVTAALNLVPVYVGES